MTKLLVAICMASQHTVAAHAEDYCVVHSNHKQQSSVKVAFTANNTSCTYLPSFSGLFKSSFWSFPVCRNGTGSHQKLEVVKNWTVGRHGNEEASATLLTLKYSVHLPSSPWKSTPFSNPVNKILSWLSLKKTNSVIVSTEYCPRHMQLSGV